MKTLLTILTAASLACPAAAQTLEALSLSADAAFLQALPQAVHPDLARAKDPSLQKPLQPKPLQPTKVAGAVVARVSLPAILDNNRHLLTRTFGARSLDLGIASDATFSSYALTFTEATTSRLAPLGKLNRLWNAGVNARIDENTVYNFKLLINLFSPMRGSTVKMTPVEGTRGPKNELKTGALIDAIRAHSVVLRVRGQELWLLYAADAKPDASGFADTRSFLFIKEDGLSSKIWPLAEARIPLDSSSSVALDGLTLTLTRTAADELIIRE